MTTIYSLKNLLHDGKIKHIEVIPRSGEKDERGHADPPQCIHVHVSDSGKTKSFYYPRGEDKTWTDSEEKAFERANNIFDEELYHVSLQIQELQERRKELLELKKNLSIE